MKFGAIMVVGGDDVSRARVRPHIAHSWMARDLRHDILSDKRGFTLEALDGPPPTITMFLPHVQSQRCCEGLRMVAEQRYSSLESWRAKFV